MYILCDGNWDNPEIEISDSPQGLIELGNLFLNISEDFERAAKQEQSEFYPENLTAILMKLLRGVRAKNMDLIEIFIDGKYLVMSGDKSAFWKLGMSLLNYFNESSCEGEHFHLDYTPQNALLAPTKCFIIFLCRG